MLSKEVTRNNSWFGLGDRGLEPLEPTSILVQRDPEHGARLPNGPVLMRRSHISDQADRSPLKHAACRSDLFS